MDSVQKYTHCEFLNLPGERRVYSPVLDDRLGVHIITEVLPKLGLKYDILLTNDEEIGQSTAQFFQSEKQYNWIFQFDRGNNDAVTYEYENPEWIKAIEPYYRVGRGSYSDICELEHLGCCGINVGTCYEDYHSKLAYANLTDLEESITKFIFFYNKYKDVHFSHTKSHFAAWREEDRYIRAYGMNSDYCEWCSEPLAIDDDKNLYEGYIICNACFHNAEEEEKMFDEEYKEWNKRQKELEDARTKVLSKGNRSTSRSEFPEFQEAQSFGYTGKRFN